MVRNGHPQNPLSTVLPAPIQQPALRPLDAPGLLLSESFDGVTFPPTNWGTTIVTGTTQGWSRETLGDIPTAIPHSGAAMAQFNSWFIFPNQSTRLYTPLLDLTGQITPTLEFWMYHNTGASSENDRIQVQISTDGGVNYTTVLTTVSRYDGSTQWKLHGVDLSAYIGQSNVRLGFLAISDFGNQMFIDDVKVGPPTVYYNAYLPIVIKPVPPAPEGHWTGTTSRGHPMSFDVSSGGATWSNFKLKTNFVIGGCSGTTETTFSGPGPITNNQFSGGSSTLSFSGQLTSLTAASGTYNYVNQFIPNCGYLTQSGTWTANLP